MNPFRLAAAAPLLFALVSPGFATTLTFGGSDAVGSLIDRQNEMFTSEVNEKGKDIDLSVNFVRGEALGSDSDVIEQMMSGGVQLFGDELGWYANLTNEFAILTWGFTFDDKDHVRAFLASPLFDEAKAKLREKNIHVLAAAPLEPRVMFSTKEIHSVEDLDGMNMRVPGIKPFLLLWEKLGTQPTQVPWAETYLALRTGVVEATDGSISSGGAARFQEVTKYLVRTDHLLSISQISINAAAFDALSAEQKKVVEDAARHAVEWAAAEAEGETAKRVEALKGEGMVELAVDKSGFADKARAGVAAMEGDGAWPEGLWEQIRALKH